MHRKQFSIRGEGFQATASSVRLFKNLPGAAAAGRGAGFLESDSNASA